MKTTTDNILAPTNRHTASQLAIVISISTQAMLFTTSTMTTAAAAVPERIFLVVVLATGTRSAVNYELL